MSIPTCENCGGRRITTIPCNKCGKLLCGECRVNSYPTMCPDCAWRYVKRSITDCIDSYYSELEPYIADIFGYAESYSIFEIYDRPIRDEQIVEEWLEIADEIGIQIKSRDPEQVDAKVGKIIWVR